MSEIIKKYYSDYEKEEKWLNEMCDKGKTLINYTWGKYTFDVCEPQEYTFRIEMLDSSINSQKGKDYITFLELSGIEHIATYGRWVYLRKKRSDGPFDIYTDIDSRLKHYQRINMIWTILACSHFSLAVSLSMQFLSKPSGAPFYIILVYTIMFSISSLVFFLIGRPYRKKIKHLKKEKNILE